MIAKSDKSICFKDSVYPPFTDYARIALTRILREFT